MDPSSTAIGFGSREYRKLAIVTGIGLAVFGALRGFRFPNGYAYTISLIDYEVGFVKRGLFGTLLHKFGDYSSASFLVAGTLLLAVSMFALFVAIYRMSSEDNHLLRASVLVFTSSYAITYMAHLNGYMDHAGILLTIIVLSISDWRPQVVATGVAFLIGALLHQALFVVFFPVVFGVLLVKVRVQKSVAGTRVVFAMGLIVGLLGVAIQYQSLAPELSARLMTSIQSHANAPINFLGLQSVVVGGSGDTFEYMSKFWQYWMNWVRLGLSLVVVLPPLFFLLYVIRRYLQSVNVEKGVRVFLLIAPLSSLAMHFVGIDMHRWNVLCLVAAFAAIYGLHCSKIRPQLFYGSTTMKMVAVLLVICLYNGIAAVPLFDEQICHSFPNFEHFRDVFSVLSAR